MIRRLAPVLVALALIFTVGCHGGGGNACQPLSTVCSPN